MIIGEKLRKLLENNKSNKLCQELLNLTSNEDWINDINYLDIAISNPNKISYITKDRLSRFNVETTKISDELIGKKIKLKKAFYSRFPCAGKETTIQAIVKNDTIIESKVGYDVDQSSIVNGIKLFKKYTTTNIISECFNESLRVKFAYMTTPGKIINKLGVQATCKEIENFSKLFYKDEMFLNIEGLRFELVKGDDIRRYYSEEAYYRIEGTLGSSCMRYDECQDYFNIYTENEDVVSMLVLFNSSNRVVGRALVWNCKIVNQDSDITLMDRIYVTDDNYVELFRNHAKRKEWYYKYKNSYSYKLEVMCPPNYDNYIDLKLEIKLNTDWEKYPYVDTFTYCSPGKLTNYTGNKSLDCTDGGPDYSADTVYSEWLDDDIDEDDAVYSDTLESYLRTCDSCYVDVNGRNDYMPEDHDDITRINGEYYHAPTSCYWSRYEDQWLLQDDAVWIDSRNDYVSESNSIYSEFHQEDILVADAVSSDYHESYMLKSECVKIGNDWIHEDSEEEYLESIKEEEDAEVTIN